VKRTRASRSSPNAPLAAGAQRGSVDAVTDSSGQGAPDASPPDLDAIEADLDAVQAALDRLADDTYWTDEVTGEAIPLAVLETEPLTRRA